MNTLDNPLVYFVIFFMIGSVIVYCLLGTAALTSIDIHLSKIEKYLERIENAKSP